jgi:hypothetical protein
VVSLKMNGLSWLDIGIVAIEVVCGMKRKLMPAPCLMSLPFLWQRT